MTGAVHCGENWKTPLKRTLIKRWVAVSHAFAANGWKFGTIISGGAALNQGHRRILACLGYVVGTAYGTY